MRLNNIGYLLKEGFRGIFLHGFMSFAAVCVTIACLVIVGSFSILAYNLDVMAHNTLRGAAGGAVLIAELLYKKGYFD